MKRAVTATTKLVEFGGNHRQGRAFGSTSQILEDGQRLFERSTHVQSRPIAQAEILHRPIFKNRNPIQFQNAVANVCCRGPEAPLALGIPNQVGRNHDTHRDPPQPLVLPCKRHAVRDSLGGASSRGQGANAKVRLEPSEGPPDGCRGAKIRRSALVKRAAVRSRSASSRAAVLGSDPQNLSAVRGGTLDFTTMATGLLAGLNKEFMIFDFPVPVQRFSRRPMH